MKQTGLLSFGLKCMVKLQTYDIGSLPFVGELEKFSSGAERFGSLTSLFKVAGELEAEAARYFEEKVVEGFVDKVKVGLDLPSYPQFRDMNAMFLSLMEGVRRVGISYKVEGRVSVGLEDAMIPEVEVIRKNSRKIYERLGFPFRLKVCVTGPYTLSSLFNERDDELFKNLGEAVSKFVSNSIFSGRHSSVGMVAVDEPVFGFLSDPLMDHGSSGREVLLQAWERIFHEAASKGVSTSIHLHDTSDELFWEVESLKVVDSHVDDPLYTSRRTCEFLERKDKFLKASLCVTDFDLLIRNRILSRLGRRIEEAELAGEVAEIWSKIKSGACNPNEYFESVEVMRARLKGMVERFGVERVLYAAPECGLKGMPTYDGALEYLRRLAEAVGDEGFNV